MNGIGSFIKDLRLKKDFSQRQLSLYSGISNTEISRIESGQRKNPSPDTLKKLAPCLGISYEELMEFAGYIEKNTVAINKESTQDELAEKIASEFIETLKKNNLLTEDKAKRILKIIDDFSDTLKDTE